jgi:hypothetical protein
VTRDFRHGRGALALGLYVLLALVFFATGLTVLGWVAAAASVVSAADLLWVADRSGRTGHS